VSSEISHLTRNAKEGLGWLHKFCPSGHPGNQIAYDGAYLLVGTQYGTSFASPFWHLESSAIS